MTITVHRIYNAGQVRGFGCGWRQVAAFPPGRKYVVLVEWATCTSAKVPVPVWRMIAGAEEPFTRRQLHCMARCMKRHLSSRGLKPNARVKSVISAFCS